MGGEVVFTDRVRAGSQVRTVRRWQRASGTLVIPAGATSGRVGLRVSGETTLEDDETFTVVLDAVTNGTLGIPSIGTVAILNDELPKVTLTGSSVPEDGNGPIAVILDLHYCQPLILTVTNTDGSAGATGDDTPLSGTQVTVPARSYGPVVVAVASVARHHRTGREGHGHRHGRIRAGLHRCRDPQEHAQQRRRRLAAACRRPLSRGWLHRNLSACGVFAVPHARDTCLVYEELSVGTAVVSTLAAVVGTAVSVVQFRRSSTSIASAAPEAVPLEQVPRRSAPSRPQARSRPADPRPSRLSSWALVFATLACLLTALSAVAYGLLVNAEGRLTDDAEVAVGVPFWAAIVIGGVGVIMALVSVVIGSRPSRGRRLRLGLLTIIGGSAPWVYLWIMNEVF